jgi:anti-sigma factor RsiW
MNTGFDHHVAEDVWEQYAMGKLSEKNCQPLEEHLLLCSACRHHLAQADEYILAVKAAAASLRTAARQVSARWR